MVSSVSNSFFRFEQLLLLLVAILCIATSVISAADINKICSKTPNPPLCHKSLESIPGAAGLDLVALGQVTIKDTIANTTETLNEITSLLSKATDPQLANNLKFCAGCFANTFNSLLKAQADFIPFNYFTVIIDVGDALDNVVNCNKTIGSSVPSLSSNIQKFWIFAFIINVISATLSHS